ncbi:MAG: hypothetical protein DRO11_10345 [Methanobacteriota archaeon]|nr:MAG: hypothetical protein DRO11_10345 [Euryarchaeota archaeon]
MRLLVVGTEEDKTVIMDGMVPCVARIRGGKVVETQRRADAGELIEKWLAAAKHNPIVKRQILKFVEKTGRQGRAQQDLLSELRRKGKIVLSGIV